jgi:hypothetical protein
MRVGSSFKNFLLAGRAFVVALDPLVDEQGSSSAQKSDVQAKVSMPDDVHRVS